MMRIYLSGPVTGIENYRQNFKEAEEALRQDGMTNVINPAEICSVLPLEHTSWDECMKVCIELLDMCDAIVLLPGWEDSRGAQRELGYAMAKNMTIWELSD